MRMRSCTRVCARVCARARVRARMRACSGGVVAVRGTSEIWTRSTLPGRFRSTFFFGSVDASFSPRTNRVNGPRCETGRVDGSREEGGGGSNPHRGGLRLPSRAVGGRPSRLPLFRVVACDTRRLRPAERVRWHFCRLLRSCLIVRSSRCHSPNEKVESAGGMRCLGSSTWSKPADAPAEHVHSCGSRAACQGCARLL